MLSLLGSLLGFGTSFLPKIMEYFQDRQDKAHELKLIAAQTEAQAKLEGVRLQATQVEADIRESENLLKHSAKLQGKASQWVVNLAASVRPVLSYLFFAEFFVLTLCVNMGWIDLVQYQAIWNNEMQAIFAAVVSFWFGSRSYNRRSPT